MLYYQQKCNIGIQNKCSKFNLLVIIIILEKRGESSVESRKKPHIELESFFDFTQPSFTTDLLLLIYSYLTPECLVTVMLVNKKSQLAAQNTLLWSTKNKLHFPFTPVNNDPYIHFQKTYINTYPNKETRKYFSLVKEIDLESPFWKDIKIGDLNETDKESKTLLQWILNSKQQVLWDAFFERIIKKRYLLGPEKTSEIFDLKKKINKNDIFYWIGIFNQINTFEFILDRDKKISDLHYKKVLYLACTHNYLNFVEFLISKKENLLNSKLDRTERLAIHIACEKGHLKIIQFILEKCPTLIDAVDKYNQSSLIWATCEGHTHVVKYLLSKKANLFYETNSNDYHNGYNALHWACLKENLEIVEILLEQEKNLNIVSKCPARKNPIHIACETKSGAIVKFLLDKYPESLECTDLYNRTPLHYAALHENIELVKLLLQHNASPFAISTLGKRPDEVTINAIIKNLLYLEILIINYEEEKNNFHIQSNLFSNNNFKRKLAAAQTLKAVVVAGEHVSLLNPYSDEFAKGKLCDIYKNLKNSEGSPIFNHSFDVPKKLAYLG